VLRSKTRCKNQLGRKRKNVQREPRVGEKKRNLKGERTDVRHKGLLLRGTGRDRGGGKGGGVGVVKAFGKEGQSNPFQKGTRLEKCVETNLFWNGGGKGKNNN